MSGRYILIDGVVKDSVTGMTFDSFWELLTVLNGQSKHLEELSSENEQLKKELKKYTDAFDCGQCRFQNYDWFDDGDEFEVCEKGNNEAQMENHSCSEWEEI